jgi:hypothetical protein
MSKKVGIFFLLGIFICSFSVAQVQVSKEPRHVPMIENKYIRLLDVWLQPGDTTWYHVHSTPSVFLPFTTTWTGGQVKGSDWVKSKMIAGEAWYTSYIPDSVIHRVVNYDTAVFHVTDMELLSSFNPNGGLKPLPFKILFDNERVFAYRLDYASFNKNLISKRGPMIAELVEGEGVLYHDGHTKKIIRILPGKYLYIEPGSTFYFSAEGKSKINLVVFEIK